MSSLFPTEPKKIRERIRRYERLLDPKITFDPGGDGYGKRYLLGPLYMLAGDLEGALASFEWFEEKYPDDDGDAYQYLAWTLALYRARQWDAACVKLYGTMLQNLYLIPHLLGEKVERDGDWDGSSLEDLDSALETPVALLAMWNADELAWVRQTSEHPALKRRVDRYVEIHCELKSEPRGLVCIHAN